MASTPFGADRDPQLKSGAARGIRTPDPRITNAMLYQLSYGSTGLAAVGYVMGIEKPRSIAFRLPFGRTRVCGPP